MNIRTSPALLGAILLVVSCEPLPLNPAGAPFPRRDPYAIQQPDARQLARPDRRYESPDLRYGSQDRRYGNPEPTYGSQDRRYERLAPNTQSPNFNNADPRSQYQRAAPLTQGRQQYPVAERTDNPGRVISPFSPYNVIDVEGFRSGQLAKDPSNGEIFRIP